MTPSPDRQDVEIRSGDDAVAAWFYPAAGAAGRAACIVMWHGFSLTRHDGLTSYAEVFAGAGTHVGDHFAPFTGEATAEVIDAQLAFWARQV